MARTSVEILKELKGIVDEQREADSKHAEDVAGAKNGNLQLPEYWKRTDEYVAGNNERGERHRKLIDELDER